MSQPDADYSADVSNRCTAAILSVMADWGHLDAEEATIGLLFTMSCVLAQLGQEHMPNIQRIAALMAENLPSMVSSAIASIQETGMPSLVDVDTSSTCN